MLVCVIHQIGFRAVCHRPDPIFVTYLAEDNQEASLTAGTITNDDQLPTQFSHAQTLRETERYKI